VPTFFATSKNGEREAVRMKNEVACVGGLPGKKRGRVHSCVHRRPRRNRNSALRKVGGAFA